jgi:hypothetical protein
MCKCMQDTLNHVTEDMKSRLPESAILSTLKSEISGQVFRFDGKSNNVPAMTINGSYQQTKTNGEVAKNAKKFDMPIFGMYCPFCGKEHNTEEVKKLWAVHIKGPDTIAPTTSKADAIFRSGKLNEEFAKIIESLDSGYAPTLEANIIEWTGTPEAHAELLAEGVDWSDLG